MAMPEICDLAEVIKGLGLSSVSDSDRALLTQLKSYAENQIRKFLRHNVTQPASAYVHYLPDRQLWAESVEYLDTVGDKVFWRTASQAGDRLLLPQTFVRSITSIYEDLSAYAGTGSGAWPASSALTEGTDYYRDLDESGLCRSGILIRIGTYWSQMPRSIKVTYNAGLTATELDGEFSDIKETVIDETIGRFKWKKSQAGADDGGIYPIKSEKFGDEYAVTYDTTGTTEQGQGLSRGAMERLEHYLNLAL